jgi:hypothetical protein
MTEESIFIFDCHLDLSMNAIEWNRDLKKSVYEIRESEMGMTDKLDRGLGTVALPELRKGKIGLVVATQIARYVERGSLIPGWNSPEIAWGISQAQLAWYRAMEDQGEMVQITNLSQMEAHLALWFDKTFLIRGSRWGIFSVLKVQIHLSIFLTSKRHTHTAFGLAVRHIMVPVDMLQVPAGPKGLQPQARSLLLRWIV